MSTTIDATFDVSLGQVPFTLEGTLTNDGTTTVFVGGFGKPLPEGGFDPLAFSDAPKLQVGLSALVTEIKAKLLGVPDTDTSFDPGKAIKDNFGSLPGLSSIVQDINNAEVRITVLSIDTAKKQYKFGFAVGFDPPATLGAPLLPIQITGFGLTVTHPSTPSTP